MWTVLLTIIFLTISIALIVYLVRLLTAAAGFHLGFSVQRWLFGRHVDRARRGDEHLAAGDLAAALRAYRASLYTVVTKDADLSEQIRRHHVGLVSRLLAIADEWQSGRVRSLALVKTDRLLQQRSNLESQYRTARRRRDRAASHRLRQQLRENAAELDRTFAALCREIAETRPSGVYH
jgi:uncharacterized protein involved in response to NO